MAEMLAAAAAAAAAAAYSVDCVSAGAEAASAVPMVY